MWMSTHIHTLLCFPGLLFFTSENRLGAPFGANDTEHRRNGTKQDRVAVFQFSEVYSFASQEGTVLTVQVLESGLLSADDDAGVTARDRRRLDAHRGVAVAADEVFSFAQVELGFADHDLAAHRGCARLFVDDGRCEREPESIDRTDHGLVIIAQGLAELIHHFVEACLVYERVRPQTVIKLFLRHGPGTLFDERFQQLQRLRAKGHTCVAARQLTALRVEDEVVKANPHASTLRDVDDARGRECGRGLSSINEWNRMDSMKKTEIIHSALASLRARITLALPEQIRACLDLLDDEQIWWRPNEQSNSVGNIVLHISGSLNHYLNRNLGGIEYDRDRKAEFAERRQISKTELLALFNDMVANAEKTFDTLDIDKLGEPSPEPKMHKLVIDDLINIVAHLANHAGQVVWITKMLRGSAVDEIWIRVHKMHAWGAQNAQ